MRWLSSRVTFERAWRDVARVIAWPRAWVDVARGLSTRLALYATLDLPSVISRVTRWISSRMTGRRA